MGCTNTDRAFVKVYVEATSTAKPSKTPARLSAPSAMAAASFSFMAESDGLEGPVNAFFNQVSSVWSRWKVAGAADFYLVMRDILRGPWLSRQSGRDESAMGVHAWGGLPPPLSVVSILLAVARTPEELRVRCGTQDSGPFQAPNVMRPERWQRLVPQISYRKGLATGPEYTIISTLRFLFSFQRAVSRGDRRVCYSLRVPLRTRTSLRAQPITLKLLP